MSGRAKTIRVGGERRETVAGIDPRSGDSAVFYVEGQPVPGEVPARDLNGGDLDRIAYVRRFRKADGDRPGPLVDGELDALADELVATGAFGRDVPRGNSEPVAAPADEPPEDTSTTTEPVTPAETPEA